MIFAPNSYNAKLEQKYFYLPKICRKGDNSCKELYKNKSVRFKISNNYIERINFWKYIFKRWSNIAKSERNK